MKSKKPDEVITSPEELVKIERHFAPDSASPMAWAAHFEDAPAMQGELARIEREARGVLADGGPKAAVHLAQTIIDGVEKVRIAIQRNRAPSAAWQMMLLMNSVRSLDDVLYEREIVVGQERQANARQQADKRRKATPERIAWWQQLGREYHDRHPGKSRWKSEAAEQIARLDAERHPDSPMSVGRIRGYLK